MFIKIEPDRYGVCEQTEEVTTWHVRIKDNCFECPLPDCEYDQRCPLNVKPKTTCTHKKPEGYTLKRCPECLERDRRKHEATNSREH